MAFGVTGQYSSEMQIFRRNLMKKVDREIWVKGKFGKLTSIMDYDKYKTAKVYAAKKGSTPPKNAIVHQFQDFKSDKGTIMDVPCSRPLTDQGRTGVAPLTNHAEQRKIFTKKITLNMRRHALQVRDTEMSEQNVNSKLEVDLFEGGASDLKDWFSR